MLPRKRLLFSFTLLGCLLAAVPQYRADDKDRKPPVDPNKKPEVDPKTPPKGPPKPGELKKYEDVITAKAKTAKGLFTVHRIEDKVYFEIPPSAYGRLMLWASEVAKAPPGAGWGGKSGAKNYLRWDRRGNKIFLWQVAFEKRASESAVQTAVESANMGSILFSFAVETENKDGWAVFNATPLFTSDSSELSIKSAVNGGALDGDRSHLEEVKTFANNIETRVLLTYRGGAASPMAPSAGGRTISVLAHYSLVQLPEKPMVGRYFDPRVGYFTRSFEDYASDKTWVERKQFIARFRLDKKNPGEALSEPVKPIVFYISREVPEKWRPYLKQGVEDWKPAFEKAGFKNAIVCKYAPTKEEDPSWDPEDASHSVIRWVAEPIANAMGPHVHDPRSGQVISAHIIFWHDILKLVQQWYFVQCAAVDTRAQKLPLPDDIIGECLRYVSAHEVGHTLGLRHNHRASSAYAIKQLRDPEFTEKHGTVASIMSYGRFNYVAQPGDNVKRLIPRIAPYDEFAIEWGYRPIAGAKTSADEKPELDRWAARQMENPWLRFGGEDGPAMVDPTVKTENIGNDPLEATALGLKNLDRVIELLVPASTRLGEDYSLLQEMYRTAVSHRGRWLGSVAALVGGVIETRSLGGRGSESFSRVPPEIQREAVQFLHQHAFSTPTKLLQPGLINRFKYFGVADDVMSQQRGLLQSLLSPRRFKLLMDAEVLSPNRPYTTLEYLRDIQTGLWSELKQEQPVTDVCRRSLQRAYLDILRDELDPKPAAAAPNPLPRRGEPDDESRVFSASSKGTDFRGVARTVLAELSTQLGTAAQKTRDDMTRVHLQDCKREVESILNPRQ